MKFVWHHHSTCHHSNFSTVCRPYTNNLVRARLLVYPPIFFSFLISPSPFSPVTLPKHKPKPIKISQAPLPCQDHQQWKTPISPTCMAARSPSLWPSGVDEHEEMWPISPFCHGWPPPTQDSVTSSLFVLSQLVFIWFVCCVSHLGFEKTVRF